MDKIISEPNPDELKVLAHQQYQTSDTLSPSTVLPSPLDQFHVWFKAAVESGKVHEPEAMSLSTATPSGIPSARIVLFKQLDSRGFVFFTNYTSRKSKELEANPNAALVFYWREIHRSVRVVGKVEKVSREESEEYFKSRPIGSQLGAWASKQSTIIGEDVLTERLKNVEEKFGDNVPLPDFWGGWRVVPNEVEFWSGKPSRLHDRVRYLRNEESSVENPSWTIERLSP
ncbi:pyridoxamine 5'-phosphate oxidase [Dendrothele bispora CBS 962.96]|uniref:pyridoxal 5'-phosphate synthase n=1 Tax=Dendrothele bispora (strain CBS 962.96) TaxID=1314807 RepID=A0A4S8MLR5_DENBC|nr:pyridoxamine 5'-phosphate oxidase [Dendrothele bispora CBS 962.96]